MKATPAGRFWSKVNKDGPVPPHRPELGPCWPWTGCTNAQGYGRVFWRGKVRWAHRVASEIETGAEPVGLLVLHACDTPSCVRWSHLSRGTQVDNMRDCAAKGRRAAPSAQFIAAGVVAGWKPQTHCRRGHALSGDNLRRDKRGHRFCRACALTRKARWSAQRPSRARTAGRVG